MIEYPKPAEVGKHVLVDFKIQEFGKYNPKFENVEHLIDPFRFQSALSNAIQSIGATILNIHIHKFEGENSGFTLNFSLSESHATIHTWPEHMGASMDIYTCGTADPEVAWETFRYELESEGIMLAGYAYSTKTRTLPL